MFFLFILAIVFVFPLLNIPPIPQKTKGIIIIKTKIPANLLDKSAHVDFADNERLRIGTGNDLQIFHDSTNSIIDDTGNGILAIRTNGDSINLRKLSDNAEILVGKPDLVKWPSSMRGPQDREEAPQERAQVPPGPEREGPGAEPKLRT